uniref:Small ribosomal subunit protein uS19c n=1 Tax=Ophirina amphinema TaxID=2108040 RepID=A0A348AYR1_9EUKA|nr:ribosomal protein S19 [Ophirina amphinema]
MSRSVWKGPYVSNHIIRIISGLRVKENRRKVYKVWSRSSVILPSLVGVRFLVHNGIKFIPVNVTSSMVGHKFGEFSSTRKKVIHKVKS